MCRSICTQIHTHASMHTHRSICMQTHMHIHAHTHAHITHLALDKVWQLGDGHDVDACCHCVRLCLVSKLLDHGPTVWSHLKSNLTQITQPQYLELERAYEGQERRSWPFSHTTALDILVCPFIRSRNASTIHTYTHTDTHRHTQTPNTHALTCR